MAGRRAPLEERFWAKVAVTKPDECWRWTAKTNNMGYGQIRTREGERHTFSLAHRVAYELANGNLHPSDCVLHRCDNPICVNPAHLFLGTKADNVADMVAKGRAGFQVKPESYRGGKPPRYIGEAHPRARLTEADVRRIRADPRGTRALAKEIGVSRDAVRAARLGRNWAHVS